ERGKRRGKRLFRELAVKRQAFVLGQRRDDRVALSAEFGALLRDQIVERGDPRLDQRDLRAVGRIFQKLAELGPGGRQGRIHLSDQLQNPHRRRFWIDHFLSDAVGGQLFLDRGDALLCSVDLAT